MLRDGITAYLDQIEAFMHIKSSRRVTAFLAIIALIVLFRIHQVFLSYNLSHTSIKAQLPLGTPQAGIERWLKAKSISYKCYSGQYIGLSSSGFPLTTNSHNKKDSFISATTVITASVFFSERRFENIFILNDKKQLKKYIQVELHVEQPI